MLDDVGEQGGNKDFRKDVMAVGRFRVWWSEFRMLQCLLSCNKFSKFCDKGLIFRVVLRVLFPDLSAS